MVARILDEDWWSLLLLLSVTAVNRILNFKLIWNKNYYANLEYHG